MINLPFTQEQFFQVFKEYNQAVWPVQILFYLFALACIYLSIKKIPRSNTLISVVLGFFWIWMGTMYHMLYFSEINPAAKIFGVVFILEGLLIFWLIGNRAQVRFHFQWSTRSTVGACLMLYALVLYPLIGYALGHRYPTAPTFGVPCPTTIFTFGLLLWSQKRVPVALYVIPVLWSLVGLSAAIALQMYEDVGLIVAAVVFLLVNGEKVNTQKD